MTVLRHALMGMNRARIGRRGAVSDGVGQMVRQFFDGVFA